MNVIVICDFTDDTTVYVYDVNFEAVVKKLEKILN